MAVIVGRFWNFQEVIVNVSDVPRSTRSIKNHGLRDPNQALGLRPRGLIGAPSTMIS